MIFTFYSYKGGVGRSLALAHVGHALAELGLRVLLVDFDLEAPGLERYCREGDDVEPMRAHAGLIDLILTYRKALTSQAEFEAASFRDWKKFVQTVKNPVNSLLGGLDLMTAGARGSSEALRDYSLTVRTFDWQDFFHNWKGDRFFEWLRQEWSDPTGGYDVVLVDSRTGVTEMGGVCAYQLADAAVLLCAPNFQNLDGTVDVARDFLSPGVLGLRRGRPLQLLAVPARLDVDHPGRADFLKEFARRLNEFFPPALGPESKLSYAELALPYLAHFAVAEPIVGGPRPQASSAEQQGFKRLRDGIGKLACALTLLAPDGSALGRQKAAALKTLAGGADDTAVALQADTSRSSAGFDFFIDYGAADAAAALELAQRLGEAPLGCNVFIDRTALKSGSGWSEEIDTVLDYSACVLVCFGAASSSPGRDKLLDKVRRSIRRRQIVPVLLPNANADALRSFGLDAMQWIDLRGGVSGADLRPFDAIARASGRAAQAATTAALQRDPYRGLAPYTEDDAGFFFGREAEVDALLYQLRFDPVVRLQGPAKVGKTSLVEAGLLPALRAGLQGQAVMTSGAVFDACAPSAAWPQWKGDATAPEGFELIVIDGVDVFAEAAGPEQRAERRARIDALVLRARLKERHLLLVGRGDWLDDAGSGPTAWDRSGSPVQLAPLAGDALKRAITQPAQRAGQLLENGLVERLIESAGPAPSAIQQVQLALSALWQTRREGWLTNRALDALGHLAGVIQSHLAPCLAALNDADRAAAAVLFRGLALVGTNGQPTARPMPWAKVRTLPALAPVGPERLREVLVAAGLLDLWWAPAEGGVDQAWVALVRLNPRVYFGDALSDDDTEFLEWRARLATLLTNRQASAVHADTWLAGQLLREAHDWLNARPHELYADERAFIEASAARHANTSQLVYAVLGARRDRIDTTVVESPFVAVRERVQPGASADEGETLSVVASPGADIVALDIANGPTLWLHPEHARELLLAQADLRRGGAAERSHDAPASAALRWRGLERISPLSGEAAREAFGDARLGALQVVDAKPALLDAAATPVEVAALADAAIDGGLYALAEQAIPASLKGSGTKCGTLPPAGSGEPMLVLIHGSFVDTPTTFGKLWTQAPAVVHDLFEHYAGRVYGFEHPTLGVGPVANALALARACPVGASLHLLAHGSGALVAEVLAQACRPDATGADKSASHDGRAGAGEREALRALQALAKRARLRVERVVRVAAAVGGMSFAGGRLDVHLSVLAWSLGLAGTPVPAALQRLMHQVALLRLGPDVFPGLQALLPGSALLRWLQVLRAPLPGRLFSVAGDSDPVMAWFKTLVCDTPGDTASDLVVPTRSMFGGPLREAGEDVMLDQSGPVAHFGYFGFERSARAIGEALLHDAPTRFRKLLPAALDPAFIAPKRRAGRRPTLLVVPGLFGSRLSAAGGAVAWAAGQLVGTGTGEAARRWLPAGLAATSHRSLLEFLARDHEVHAFAYDWRQPLEDEARRLADALEQALESRASAGAPVQMLAHSTGGLLVRALQLEAPALWDRWMARPGTRVLMLGTPHQGLWAPMQLLAGDGGFADPCGLAAETVGDAPLRQGFAGFAGLLGAQAGLLDTTLALHQRQAWVALAEADLAGLHGGGWLHSDGGAATSGPWGLPPQAVLDRAVALRRRLDAQHGAFAANAGGRLLTVVGRAEHTPLGVEMTESGLVHRLGVVAGDGLVSDASALLPGLPAWRMPCGHFEMTRHAVSFEALAELLRDGSTGRLERVADPVPGAAPAASPIEVRARRSRTPLPFAWPASAVAPDPGAPDAAIGLALAVAAPLRVTVTNGDLSFCAWPLMLGHYVSDALTGTEAVADRQLAQALGRALATGLYPAPPGTSHIFDNAGSDLANPMAGARPPAVLVVGLGEEGRLRADEFAYAIRSAVLAWAQRVHSKPETGARFELASALVGSGSGNLSVGHCAQLIVQGVRAANDQLLAHGMPVLGQLHLVELYHDRACEAWRALRWQATAAPQQLELVGPVGSGTGALRRSLSAYRGTSYDLLTALLAETSGDPTDIAFSLDTRRSRVQLRAQRRRSAPLGPLVLKGSNEASLDPRLGRTLFELLVPPELQPYFGGSTETVLKLDSATASIPWELIDSDASQSGDARPWAVRCKVLRKLSTDATRRQAIDAAVPDSALVIGEPKCDPATYPSLLGACREARVVADRLVAPGSGIDAERVRVLTDGADAQTVMNALFEQPWRLLHIVGHGEPGGGVVLSGANTLLGANEVRAMRTVPELVFLNCCHLPARDTATAPAPYDRAAFAANMAEELIRCGVRCVIAAGWAVEDMAAEQFATSFYSALLGGARFIDAVGAARAAAWAADRAGATWGAYQCYGDPDWVWRRAGAVAQRAGPGPGDVFTAFDPRDVAPAPQRQALQMDDEFAEIASPPDLALALETLATRCQFGNASPRIALDKVRYLDAEYGLLWGAMGAVAEAFGLASAAARDIDSAIRWYRAAVDARDGSASFKAAEQLGNLLVRAGSLMRDAAAGRRSIEAGIACLQRLSALQPTDDRESLLGSAFKRLTLLETAAGRKRPARQALQAAITHYAAAEALARAAGASHTHYATKNGIGAELREAFLAKRRPQIDAGRLRRVRDELRRVVAETPDFWSVVAESELLILQALAEGRLAKNGSQLVARLRELHARVPAATMWDAVYSEARFTLLPYLDVAAPGERRAAQQLLEALKTMATT